MNEITTIHLGRSPFTIAVDAHKVLRLYLHEIGKRVGHDEEVLKEVELRMAELLTARGMTPDKVVLLEDIAYLKEQLGEPADFGGDAAGEHTAASAGAQPGGGTAIARRLFRDTENAMLAGVSAGLGAYFGISPLIFRLLFVIMTVSGGTGILIYLLLWLLVPAAQSESDRLQMRGKAVTVDSIKAAVEQADVAGAASRAAKGAEKVFLVAGKVLLGLAGIAVMVVGIGVILAAGAAAAYSTVRGYGIGGQYLFPVGIREHLAVYSGIVVVGVLGFLAIVAGRALIRRKWGIPGWLMAGLVAVFVASGALCAALTVDSIDRVRSRFESVQHVENRPLPAFRGVTLHTAMVSTVFEISQQYGIEIRSIGTVDTSGIRASVTNGKLIVDASHVKSQGCSLVCPYGPTNVQVIVHAPQRQQVNDADTGSAIFYYNTKDELFNVDAGRPPVILPAPSIGN